MLRRGESNLTGVERGTGVSQRAGGAASTGVATTPLRVGVITNPRSHLNVGGVRYPTQPDHFYASPRTADELAAAIGDYHRKGVNLLIVDGGDGTVREVLTAAAKTFAQLPRFAVIPSGKTNALALDLGIHSRWSVPEAYAAARAGRFVSRSPIEITRPGASAAEIHGFLFGAGKFVDATHLAHRANAVGAFNGLAVGLSLAWSVLQTLFGGKNNTWKQGEVMQLRVDDAASEERSLYLLLASTLERFPLALKPFGHCRSGLKVLAIDAPPQRILTSLLPLLTGSERGTLHQRGYRRCDPRSLTISLSGRFALDGELYEGGEITLRMGRPLQFAVP